MQYPFPLHAEVEESRLCDQPKECVCVWGKELGLLFYASPLPVSLNFTFLKLFLYTQSVVRVLYLVRVLYSVRRLGTPRIDR